jgi:hypothetical protein
MIYSINMSSSDTLYVIENILYSLLDLSVLILAVFLFFNLIKYKKPSLTKSIIFEILFFISILGVSGNIVLTVNDIEILNNIELIMSVASIVFYALCLIFSVMSIIINIRYSRWIKKNEESKNAKPKK